VIEAVIFDLDGVLIDSEPTWNSAREQLVRERGGTWREEATREMMGMSSPEWSRHMHDGLGVEMEPAEIAAEVVRRMEALYRQHLPIIDGAREAVSALAAHWRLGLASSANRQLIELVLDLAGIREYFAVAVSAEEVDHGKPAPDVYLEAAMRIGVRPRSCAAVEDSTNGLRAAASAGMLVIAVPNREFPPTADALRLADVALESLDQLRPKLLSCVGARAH
jgi:HAD superfamily hydrolase (TIGR01509 family)